MPPKYEQDFYRTLLIFLHQRVWDPRTKSLVHLRPLGPKEMAAGDLDYLGPDMDVQVAQGIVEGGNFISIPSSEITIISAHVALTSLNGF